MSLLPREHGAYGQLAFPVVSSLALAGVSPSSVLIAGAVVALFVAHEPTACAVGPSWNARAARTRAHRHRLACGRRRAGPGAWPCVICAGAGEREMVVWTAASGRHCAGRRHRGRSGKDFWRRGVCRADVLVPSRRRCALRPAPTPRLLCRSRSSSPRPSSHRHLRCVGSSLDVRAGGDPRAARTARLAALMLACVAIAGLLLAAVSAILPWVALAAAVPGLLTATWLALRPPQSSRLRDVGWVIIAASASIPVIFLVFVTG